jgi:hypothetical protein
MEVKQMGSRVITSAMVKSTYCASHIRNRERVTGGGREGMAMKRRRKGRERGREGEECSQALYLHSHEGKEHSST